ncbi:MAG: NAD(P)/FAD-dependent oxidoreductase [Rhodospirillales bacterium]|nr:NAD(P)/FAD-dependent oxidoreductase [Rhodospirillales bacterium]
MTESVECVVVGAGVVGLAIARALALQGREVIVLEAEEAIGTHTSSRNSEVIHAGIYYPAGSLKAKLCVEGKKALYPYCKALGVPFDNCGKLIVACSEAELAGLEKIRKQALANGVDDLTFVEPAVVRQMEPEVQCLGALQSPSTGIIDSHSLMVAYQGEAEAGGTMIAFHSPVASGRVVEGGVELTVGGENPMQLHCRILVNSAGLGAPALGAALQGFPQDHVPPGYLCKGNYFTLSGVKSPFRRLIYPAPEQAGLGVHVTIDMGGQARFGPDVEWVDKMDYNVDPKRSESFYAAIRRYWPGLPDGALAPGYSGMRPKLQKPGEPAKDFMIEGPKDHGVPGVVQLFGIESPGLTASLAIADLVVEKLAA